MKNNVYYNGVYQKTRQDLYDILTRNCDKHITVQNLLNYIQENSDRIYDLSKYLDEIYKDTGVII